jgi:class 3 adenylate cyclase/CHASE2 domain-containing sensor protein
MGTPLGPALLNRRRLFSRESPLWGFLVGLAATLAVAGFTGSPWLQALENVFLDLRFKHRPAIPVSPHVAVVDIDDESINFLGPLPWPRDRHGELIRQLRALGARVVALDIRFARPAADETTPFDEATGRFTAAADDPNVRLREAIGEAQDVVMIYEFDLGAARPPADLEAAIPRVAQALRQDAAAPEERLRLASGLAGARYQEAAALLRRAGLQQSIAEAIGADPDLTYGALLARALPEPRRTPKNVLDFRTAWDQVQARRILERKASRPISGAAVPAPEGLLSSPPMRELAEASVACGITNATYDSDGILRRPPLFVRFEGRLYPHAGLAAVQAWFEADGVSRATLEGDAAERLFLRVRRADAIVHEAMIRMDARAEGCVLVDWTGRDKFGGLQRLSYGGIIDLWRLRRWELQEWIRQAVENSDEPTREATRKRYPAVFEASADPGAFEREQSALADELLAAYGRQIDEKEEAVRSLPPDLPTAGLFREAAERLRAQRERLAETVRQIHEREARLRPLVRDKICFVGLNATAQGDLHATPLDDTVPGVNALIAVANMFLEDRFPLTLSVGADRLLTFLLGLATGLLCSLTRPRVSLTASVLLLAGIGGAAHALFAARGVVVAVAGPWLAVGAAYTAVVTTREIAEFRARRRLQGALTGRSHPEITRLVLEDPERLERPHQAIATLMFTDLAGFTTISEAMGEEQLVVFVNRCHELISDHVVSAKGYVDKFMGDGVMAVFGPPLDESDDHARNACTAALGALAAIQELNRDLERRSLPRASLRIGINTGRVVTGMVGSAARHDFTAMGDTVNVAARLEPLNKMYGSTVLVGPETRRLAGGEFLLRELDRIRVKGRREALPVYELLGRTGDALREPQVEAYNAARELFLMRRWTEAAEAFEAWLRQFGADGAVSLYVRRAQGFAAQPPPPDWDGAFDMGFK